MAPVEWLSTPSSGSPVAEAAPTTSRPVPQPAPASPASLAPSPSAPLAVEVTQQTAGTSQLPSPGGPDSMDYKTVTFTVPPPLFNRRGSRETNRPLFSERQRFTPSADKLVLVMVGLPARGKSFIAKKLWKFFCWKGLRCEVFNVGQLRRAKSVGMKQDHSFFDPNNTKAKEEREMLALESLKQVQRWFAGEDGQRGGDVAVFDATNTTKGRRKVLREVFSAFAEEHKTSVHVVFVESICTSDAVINANIKQKVESSPDYQNMPEEEAFADLKQRLKNYEAAYEALEDEEDCSYIKLFDMQSKVHAKGIYGHVAKSILPYMMSFHIEHRPIWLVRAGHCTEVRRDFRAIIKDPCVAPRSARLSPLGVDFAYRLGEFVKQRTAVWMENEGIMPEDNPTECLVMTSTLPRAVETADFLPYGKRMQMGTLNPLDKGECYGMTMDQMKDQMPEAYAAYEKDPWRTRFPGGESYQDLMLRLEPVLIDIEQHTGPVLVVSHISTLQVLYSYFLGAPIESSPDLEIPFHSVLELVPSQDGWTKTVFNMRA
ncbi:6-phosphofructo-2-kinase/fructose-2,6-bisphosphatase [Phytophthora ramorum]|uniref:6-phosphofructo-2-kinase/fructose-2, 6-bisphosphatase n=1 Tax=Phytophthora ramorum TaxID=164328 RepID=UPI0030AF297E|nr:6-phosphofructo-2-kinase/fructose-2,6-bisphosphatase [Phytophthora ramorum]